MIWQALYLFGLLESFKATLGQRKQDAKQQEYFIKLWVHKKNIKLPKVVFVAVHFS